MPSRKVSWHILVRRRALRGSLRGQYWLSWRPLDKVPSPYWTTSEYAYNVEAFVVRRLPEGDPAIGWKRVQV